MTSAPLHGPEAIRLPGVGLGWFRPSRRNQGRGPEALAATVVIDGVPVQVASTHLENRTDAEHRAEQMEVLLQAVDERGDGGPAIVGGDLKALGARRHRALRPRPGTGSPCRHSPARLSWPVDHEPLFEVARARGFTWTDANVAAPTTVHDGAGLPDHVPLRLDWLLVRGSSPADRPSSSLAACPIIRWSPWACVSRDRDPRGPATGRYGRHPLCGRRGLRRQHAGRERGARHRAGHLGRVRAGALLELVADDGVAVVAHTLAAGGRLGARTASSRAWRRSPPCASHPRTRVAASVPP